MLQVNILRPQNHFMLKISYKIKLTKCRGIDQQTQIYPLINEQISLCGLDCDESDNVIRFEAKF